MPNNFFIAIAGNIGCGKSALTTLLSHKFGWKPYYEIVDTNPYLADFYKDMLRWSFPLQMFFLTKRFKHQQEIASYADIVIQDRTIYEDVEIFAKNLYLQGKMSERDYKTYSEHFYIMIPHLKVPDLLIYLRANVPTLKHRIQLRGRDYEQAIPEEYLQQLNEHYEDWIRSYKMGPTLTLDVGKKDFVQSPKDLETIGKIISWEVTRLKNKSQVVLPLPQRSKEVRGSTS